jgi:hypothetical protein
MGWERSEGVRERERFWWIMKWKRELWQRRRRSYSIKKEKLPFSFSRWPTVMHRCTSLHILADNSATKYLSG